MSTEESPRFMAGQPNSVLSATERVKQALARNPDLPLYGTVAVTVSSPDSFTPAWQTDELAYVRQLRSAYSPDGTLELPLGLGDYLSLLFLLDEQDRLIEERGAANALLLRRSWYLGCCTALRDALKLTETAFDTLAGEKAYDARRIVGGLRQALRDQHGVFQAVYYELAIGGLLRQRGDVLSARRSVSYLEGGPGSGIADESLKARIRQVYFAQFDEALLVFSRQLLDIDELLVELLPITVGQPVELAVLQAQFNYPDGSDHRWTAAFAG